MKYFIASIALLLLLVGCAPQQIASAETLTCTIANNICELAHGVRAVVEPATAGGEAAPTGN